MSSCAFSGHATVPLRRRIVFVPAEFYRVTFVLIYATSVIYRGNQDQMLCIIGPAEPRQQPRGRIFDVLRSTRPVGIASTRVRRHEARDPFSLAGSRMTGFGDLFSYWTAHVGWPDRFVCDCRVSMATRVPTSSPAVPTPKCMVTSALVDRLTEAGRQQARLSPVRIRAPPTAVGT